MPTEKLTAKQWQELGQAEFDNMAATGFNSFAMSQVQRAMNASFQFGYQKAKEEAANEAILFFKTSGTPYGKELAQNIEALEYGQ